MNSCLSQIALAAAACLCTLGSASATEVYTGVGLPGALIGIAHAVDSNVVVRADASTVGRYTDQRTRDGVDYDITARLNRLGLFADYYFDTGFRFTGGMTVQNARADLVSTGKTQVVLGASNYVTSPDDRFDVHIKFPKTMPYLGIGYGLAPSSKSTWSFVFDLGMSFGKPKATATATGPLLSSTVTQADVDAELEETRRDLDKVVGIPQLSIGVAYRF